MSEVLTDAERALGVYGYKVNASQVVYHHDDVERILADRLAAVEAERDAAQEAVAILHDVCDTARREKAEVAEQIALAIEALPILITTGWPEIGHYVERSRAAAVAREVTP